MTGPGTNQYLVGDGAPLLIDVASYDAENRRRLDAGLAGAAPKEILLTHIHPDHVGGASALRDAAGVPLAVHRSRAAFAFGARPLEPDRLLDDGNEIVHASGRLRAVHTPGHESGHLCYYDPDERALFTGDLILGTGTTVVAPPDGDMAAYLASLQRVLDLGVSAIAPGHGRLITDPAERVGGYLAHRRGREQQVIAALTGPSTVDELVARIYVGVPEALLPVARYSVWAHLRKLRAEERASTDGDPADIHATWRCAPS